jgi:inhibitor of KinA sporulation pathway (predicted exonuclease)
MAAVLSHVYVVDCEATCWETKQEQGNQPNEVIEIGICVLELKTGKILDPSGYVVKPLHTKVSPFCTKLTGWTQAEIDEGSAIQDVLHAIAADYHMTKDHIWFSCGEYDRVKLGSSGRGSLMDLYGIKRESNPFAWMRAHVNIKTLFAMKHKLGREMGMDKMLAHIGEPLEGQHHKGVDDAYNIAKIVRSVLA